MYPILGILASAGKIATSFESIATVTIGAGGSAQMDFTSIASTYKHLQIRMISRSLRAAGDDSLVMRVGNTSIDTGSNYAYHYIRGTGASADASAATSQTSMTIGDNTGNTATSGIFGVAVIDILDYANTNKYKTIRTLAGFDANGSGIIKFSSGLWMSTSAINAIRLYAATGNLAQYTTAALYGVKG